MANGAWAKLDNWQSPKKEETKASIGMFYIG